MSKKKSVFWKWLENQIGMEITVRELANMLDMDRSETVRRWFVGAVRPDWNSCKELGKILNVDSAYLFSAIQELKD